MEFSHPFAINFPMRQLTARIIRFSAKPWFRLPSTMNTQPDGFSILSIPLNAAPGSLQYGCNNYPDRLRDGTGNEKK